MFERILVCLDGSELAEEILPLAEQQAGCFHSAVTLFQAINGPVQVVPATALEAGMLIPPSGPEIALVLKETQEIREQAKVYLEQKAAELLQKGIKADFFVAEGSAGETILDYAEKNAIDLIALATHGRSSVGRALFGSVADHVLKNAVAPILIIRPRAGK